MELSERLLQLLGKRDDDPELLEFLHEFRPYLHTYAYELLKLYNFGALGFSLFFNGNAGSIERVSFHIFTSRVASGNCQPFKRLLPFSVPPESSRDEVQRILGIAPEASRAEGSSEENPGNWHDVYCISPLTIDFIFGSPDGKLKFVSATSNEITPIQDQDKIDAMLWRTCMFCGEHHDAASRFVIESNDISVCHVCVAGLVNQFRERKEKFSQRAGCSLCSHKASRKNSVLRIIERGSVSVCEICAEELDEGLARFVDRTNIVNKIAEPDMHFPDFEPKLDTEAD